MPSLSEKLQPFHLALLACLVWVFVLGNVVLAGQLWSALKPSTWQDLAFVASVLVFFFCATVMLVSWLCHGTLAKPVLGLLVLAAAFFSYGQISGQMSGQNLGQVFELSFWQNPEQSFKQLAFLASPQPWLHMAVLAAPPLVLLAASPAPAHWLSHTKSFVLLNALCILTMALLLSASPVQYAALLRNHHNLAQHINPAQPVLLAGQWLGENAHRLWQAHAKPLLADVQ